MDYIVDTFLPPTADVVPVVPAEEPVSNWAGNPRPEDKFVKVGRCASTGREITICYNTFGNPSDPCLLLVMGLGGTAWNWDMEMVNKFVAAGFYVVRFDNRDSGLSTHLDGCATVFIARMILPSWASLGEGQPPYTLNDMADDSFNLLTALGIETAHLLGASMGGMIVQCMALRHPERVKSLTIVFSHSNGPNVKPQTCGMLLKMLQFPASNSPEDLADFFVKMARQMNGDYDIDEAETRESITLSRTRCPKQDQDGALRQIWAIQRGESRDEELGRLRSIPTLIVHGLRDEMIPFENGMQLAKLIPGSKLVCFAGMAHTVPYQLFDAIVEEVELLKRRAAATRTEAIEGSYSSLFRRQINM